MTIRNNIIVCELNGIRLANIIVDSKNISVESNSMPFPMNRHRRHRMRPRYRLLQRQQQIRYTNTAILSKNYWLSNAQRCTLDVCSNIFLSFWPSLLPMHFSRINSSTFYNLYFRTFRSLTQNKHNFPIFHMHTQYTQRFQWTLTHKDRQETRALHQVNQKRRQQLLRHHHQASSIASRMTTI